MRITTRSTLDPAGRQVDIYVRPEQVAVLAMEKDPSTSIERLRKAAYEVMADLAKVDARRLRDRDLTIFFCEWTTSFGQARRGIALPPDPAAEIFNMFRRHPDIYAVTIEGGDGDPRDVGAVPMLRYYFGEIIAYSDPFDDIAEIVSLGKGIEIRSAIFEDHVKRNSIPRWALPEAPRRRTLPFRHSIGDWEDFRYEILRFIHEMLSNGTYQWLRREVRDGFGIRVEEQTASMAGRFGSLGLDWIAEDLTYEIVISVNKHLSTADKYVVLAHELAHATLHLPLLFLGQITEQSSWSRPELSGLVEQRIATVFGDRSILEKDANRLASYMLVPPRIDVDALTRVAFEGSRAFESSEMLWRLFQHSFPEARMESYSWHNLRNLEDRARRELAEVDGLNGIAPESLYLVMLEATLSRTSSEGQDRRQWVEDGIDEIFDIPSLATVSAADISMDAQDPLTVDGPSQVRRVIEPLAGPDSLASRIPLVPASRGNKWRTVIDSAMPARPLEDWREDYPNLAMIVYPDKSAPSFPVYTL